MIIFIVAEKAFGNSKSKPFMLKITSIKWGFMELYSVDPWTRQVWTAQVNLYVDFFFFSVVTPIVLTGAWLVISLNIKDLCIQALTTYYTQMFLLHRGWVSLILTHCSRANCLGTDIHIGVTKGIET